MLKNFLNDESGVIISAEIVIVLTVAVLAMIVGLAEVAVAVNTELNDISNALGSLTQSYFVTNYKGFDRNTGKSYSFYSGSQFLDQIDDGDLNTSCDIVCGTPTPGEGGAIR